MTDHDVAGVFRAIQAVGEWEGEDSGGEGAEKGL